jgi:hypothetical protein
MVLMGKVLMTFERRPVEKPAKRWVIVADESSADSGVPVEAQGRNPAA